MMWRDSVRNARFEIAGSIPEGSATTGLLRLATSTYLSTLFALVLSEELEVTKRLYVGNLPYSATEAQIRTLFEEAGEIAGVTLITDRETGRSKGFGFVEMSSEEEAQEAIRRFNGYSLNNRNLTVNEARPREERSGGGDGRSGGYGDRRGGDRY
jgi:cold-inducible RNA-binding protein